MSTPLSFATRAVHAGERAPHPDYTPVVTPIYPSVAYAYDSMDDVEAVFAGTREGYVYARYGSPTVQAFEVAVADLEGAEAAVAFGSGMAAIHAALLGAGVRAGAAVVRPPTYMAPPTPCRKSSSPRWALAPALSTWRTYRPWPPPCARNVRRRWCVRSSPTRCSRWPTCPPWPPWLTRPVPPWW